MAKEKRVEILFEPNDYRVLEQVAGREGKSVGAVVRDAVARYVVQPTEAERKAAWDHFFSLEFQGGPSGSPEEIKEEILKGYDEDDKRLYENGE
jgi:hypothetical protein